MTTSIHNHSESGGTLIVAALTTLVLGSFVAIAVEYTGTIGRNAQRDRTFNNAVEIGDGCLELAFGAWRQLSKQSENPPTNTFAAIPTPSPGSFPMVKNFTVSRDGNSSFTVSNFKVQAVDPMVTLQREDPPLSSLDAASPPPKTTGPGTGTKSYFYLATADVTLPYQAGKQLTAKVRRVFEKRYTSAWNWAMLYDGDLELHPDSPLTLNGWVHSNKNVYVGNGTVDATSTPPPNLTLGDRLSYTGQYKVGFSNDLHHVGQTNVAEPTTPADFPPGRENNYSPFEWDTSKFNTTDSDPNNDGYREMIERAVASSSPDPFGGVDGNGKPLQNSRLYNQADCAVEIRPNPDPAKASDPTQDIIKIYRGVGANKKDVTAGGNTNDNMMRDAVLASVRPGFSIQDNRETATVRVANFDVGTFRSYYDHHRKGWNGIVYLSDTSNSSTNKRAIRVVNGTHLPEGGMTIVSNNPVYVQGDFNSGRTTTSGGEPPSNTGDPSDPDAGTYKRQPASVMGDAVTLLSNNWNDSNSTKTLSERIASNTTVNAALVAGQVATSGASYSGGGENYVRFLEDWTGKRFTYYGSMIGIFQSKHATGLWTDAVTNNAYKPAQLNWFFDRSLSVDAQGNPVRVPGYVSTVAYLQQQRWYLQY